MDIFHLNKINKKALSLNKEIIIITEFCEKYAQDPSEQNGSIMIEAIIEADKNLKDIKKSVADLVNKVDKEVVDISKKENGYIIKD
jgi:hypothetical protein